MTSPDLPRDPLDLECVDREIRINELEERARELGMSSSGASEQCPPEVHEQFLRHMIDFENGPVASEAEQLAREGVPFPPAGTLDDATLHEHLWRIINTLARRSTYLHNTNHLSDRQLYERLWSDALREETTIMPPNSGWQHHIDMIGSGSEEHIQLGLRYYDSEESRQHWARDFPDMVIPPHEDPPFDRDRLLPKAPEPQVFECDEADEDEVDDEFETNG